MSTNHCTRTSCWWVHTCAPHLVFVHLTNWHFSLHLPTFQLRGICAVDNFQRFRFGSHPTSSQEIVKQESTFTFIFTLPTIYKVDGTARYLESFWPVTDNDAILTLYLIHILSLTLSTFYRAPIYRFIHPSIHWYIDRSITPSIDQSINPSINPSINQLIHRTIDTSIHRSIHQSIERLINPSINPSINQFIHRTIDTSIHWSIHRSINQSIGQYIDR